MQDVRAGSILLADKHYDTDVMRAETAGHCAFPNIPPRIIRRQTFTFSSWLCRQRNAVERFFNRIKQMRGIAIRHDGLPENYLIALELAAIRI